MIDMWQDDLLAAIARKEQDRLARTEVAERAASYAAKRAVEKELKARKKARDASGSSLCARYHEANEIHMCMGCEGTPAYWDFVAASNPSAAALRGSNVDATRRMVARLTGRPASDPPTAARPPKRSNGTHDLFHEGRKVAKKYSDGSYNITTKASAEDRRILQMRFNGALPLGVIDARTDRVVERF